MNRLSSLNTILEVDLLGFIRSWKYKNITFDQPSYLVFFKDYSRLDPFCRLWNTDSSIDEFILRGDNISYTKTVESVKLQCNIAVQDNGWDWRIFVTESCPSHRFGIATPCGTGELNNLGKPIETRVSQYFRATQDIFSDQTFLDIPIVSCDEFSLFCSMKYDAQFFSYQDGEQQYLRLTQATNLCPEITISCRIAEPKQHKAHYIDLYPPSTEPEDEIMSEDVSVKEHLNLNEFLDSVHTAFADLKTQNTSDLTVWMDIIRTCRQPQIFWEVDYIEPKEQLTEINAIIREFEQIYYPKKTSITLRKEFSADLNQQAAFNTIRAHLHAENGDFDTSLALFRGMMLEWKEDLSTIRQSNLMFHSCLAALCCGHTGESYAYFCDHGILTNHSTIPERVGLGLEDNDTLLRMVYWFFIKHVQDFRDFFCAESGVKPSELWNHKKISILYLLEYDNAWVASLCGLAFYNHAREIHSGLPAYERRPGIMDRTGV